MGSSKTIRLVFEDNLEGMACYCPGEDAEILIDLRACCGVANAIGSDPKELITEGLAHELMHAVQDNFGLLFEEVLLHEAMGDPAEVLVMEGDMQAEEINLSIRQVLSDAANALAEALAEIAPGHPALKQYGPEAIKALRNSIIDEARKTAEGARRNE